MTQNLKLIKKQETQTQPELESPIKPALTSAELSEATRFKTRTAAKAIRRARMHRLMDTLEKPDQIAPAA